jgi:hypothetical protein
MKLSALTFGFFRALTGAAPLKMQCFATVIVVIAGVGAASLRGAGENIRLPAPVTTVAFPPALTARVPAVGPVATGGESWRAVPRRPWRRHKSVVPPEQKPPVASAFVVDAVATASYLVEAQVPAVPTPPQKFTSLWFEYRRVGKIADADARRKAFVNYYICLHSANENQRQLDALNANYP